MKKRIYQILEKAEHDDPLSRTVAVFLIALITLNVLVVILETVEGIDSKYHFYFHVFDVVSVALFTIEYLLRLWSCTVDEEYSHPIWGRLRLAVTPMAVIDLLAILPFYLPIFVRLDLRFLRALRLFRLFRLFKIGRYSESLQIFISVIKKKKEELVISFFSIMILLVIASSLLYYTEHDVQPKSFSSIVAAMWWGVTALSTVNYGDMVPVTPMGKFFASIVAIMGIGVFALPAGILASGFSEAIHRKIGKIATCPYCGKKFHDTVWVDSEEVEEKP